MKEQNHGEDVALWMWDALVNGDGIMLQNSMDFILLCGIAALQFLVRAKNIQVFCI
jgi:hypothetical protein